MSKKVVFTICNYNAHKPGSLDNALAYLSKAKDDDTIIACFDNASKDGSDDILSQYYKSGLIDILILSKKNMGKAYAMNYMLRQLVTTYNLNAKDILVNMDSDISIVDSTLINKLRATFDADDSIKYIGFKYFSNEALTMSSSIDYPETYGSINIAGIEYEFLKNQHNLGGGLLAMKIDHFIAVNGYNENLGKNRTPAFYGGDDAVLIAKLFKHFSNEKALRCTDPIVWHPDTLDLEYKKWKADVNHNMCYNGFGNSNLPEKGFYD